MSRQHTDLLPGISVRGCPFAPWQLFEPGGTTGPDRKRGRAQGPPPPPSRAWDLASEMSPTEDGFCFLFHALKIRMSPRPRSLGNHTRSILQGRFSSTTPEATSGPAVMG